MSAAKAWIAGAALLIASIGAASAAEPTIIDEWGGVLLPPPPTLKPASVDPRKTALLLLDFTTQTCTLAVRPRCAATVPHLAQLLKDARAHGVTVIYSVATADAKPADILAPIKPESGEEILPPLGPDKFLNSALEATLKSKGIDTIIITGTAAQTSVLHTGGEAALRGFNVITPVDGLSSNEAFPELYTVWHLANAARIAPKTIVTRVDMITYK